MKHRISALVLSLVMMFSLAACTINGGGNVKNVRILESETSEIYSEKDISDAVSVAINYFHKGFGGCTLTSIGYAGDEKTLALAEWAEEKGYDQVIVLTSSFDVDGSGGDGSLNPNSTYDQYQWILVRNEGGSWNHADHGYG